MGSIPGTPAGGESRPTLPPLPGCGRPAVAQFELYSPRESLHGSLDGDVYLCAEHADHAALRQASGLTPHQLPAPRAEGHRCGDGWDFLAMRALHAPEVASVASAAPNPYIDRAVTALQAFGVQDRVAAAALLDLWRYRAELSVEDDDTVLRRFPLPVADDPFYWCEWAPEHQGCAERAEHRSTVRRVGADVANASAAITLMLVALLDKAPHRPVLAAFLWLMEEDVRRTYLLPIDQAAALSDELRHLLRVAGVRP